MGRCFSQSTEYTGHGNSRFSLANRKPKPVAHTGEGFNAKYVPQSRTEEETDRLRATSKFHARNRPQERLDAMAARASSEREILRWINGTTKR